MVICVKWVLIQYRFQDYIFAIVQPPLFTPADAKHVKVTVHEITDQLWSSRNFLANVKPEDGKNKQMQMGPNLANIKEQHSNSRSNLRNNDNNNNNNINVHEIDLDDLQPFPDANILTL